MKKSYYAKRLVIDYIKIKLKLDKGYLRNIIR